VLNDRLARTFLGLSLAAAIAVPATGAQARQGADDPAGHVRHASHQTTTQAKHQSGTRHRHGRRHGRRADDRVADRRGRGRGTDDARAERRGRGTDDGPNHS
jgi:hypothetical protein